MKDINETRNRINGLDQKIASLLNERFLLLDDVLEHKISNKEYIENPSREREVLDKILQSTNAYNPFLKEIYRSIMDASKCYQWNRLFKGNIYIIGFMAVGKTTLGKKFSKKIQWEFIDTDLWIEEMEKRKITEIFAKEGEDYFRELEKKVIKTIDEQWKANKIKRIVACGGGVTLTPDNIVTMKNNGIIVHLEGDINTICQRISLDQSRPLVSESKNLKQRVEKLLEERRDVYKEVADITLYTEDESPDKLVEKLMLKLEDYEQERSLTEE